VPLDARYAKTDDGVHVAYATLGEGPPLVVCPTFVWSIEWAMEDAACVHFLDRLAEFSKVIIFDKRGTGRSDPIVGAPTLEERAEDIRAVMDATLADRAVLFGISEGGAMAIMFAATHPERTAGLITWSTFIRTIGDEGDMDDPFVGPRNAIEAWADTIAATWGEGSAGYPDQSVTEAALQRSEIRRQQLSASPAMAEALARLNAQIDIRPIIPSVKVPTLVMHRTGETLIRPAHSRYIADHIEGARHTEFAGTDHFPWLGDADAAIGEIEEFVTGVRPALSQDRVLATILFTDLVASTDRASHIGDRAWRDLIDRYGRLVKQTIQRHRGTFVRSTGDGALATFDGPSRAVRCAKAVVQAIGDLGLESRVGLHTGEVELIGDDVGGIAVHIAERVMSLAEPRQILVSSTVKDLSVGSGIFFEDQGERELRGVPEPWRIFAAKVP
jgi:class 3 adenylate cyclase